MTLYTLAMISSEKPRPVEALRIKSDGMAVPAIGWLIFLCFSLGPALMMASVTERLEIPVKIGS
jgi:hypothetical protein